MDVNHHSLKIPSRIALVAMVVLCILGAIYYKERAIFSDAAFRLFNLINYSGFDLPGNRYGAFVVQVLPYLARKLHLSVKIILFCYSVGYYLFYFFVAGVIVFVFRQYRLAILMVLYYLLFCSESYIWVSETYLASAWMFLLFSVIQHIWNTRPNLFLLLPPFLLLAFLTIFSHFVILIPMAYLWIYLILEKKNWPFSRNVSILLTCLLAVVIALKCLDTTSAYDNDHLRGVTHFSLQDILDAFTSPFLRAFYYRCVTNYWLGTMVFIISIATLVKNNDRRLAIWTFLSALGYIIIMGLTYAGPGGESILLFHIESEWSGIAIIVATPFVFDFLPRLKSSTAAWVLAVIFVVRILYIISFLQPFTERNNMTEKILAQMRKKGIDKLALYNDAHLMSVSKLYWGLPYESLYISSMDGNKPQLTFLFVNPDEKQIMENIKNPKLFVEAFGGFPSSLLNKDYFQVDSTKPYTVMTYAELLK